MLLRPLLISVIIAVVHVFIVECCGTGQQTITARAFMLTAVPGGTPTQPAGTVTFVQQGDLLRIFGTVTGLTTGQHGMHVHVFGSLGNGCLAAGDHYNPTNMTHGGRNSAVRHVGDLGNIFADVEGVAIVNIQDELIMRLNGPESVIGRALIVHSMVDDLGLGGSPLSSTTGNSGARVKCGIIEMT